MRNSEKKPMTRTKKIILTVVIVLLVLVLSALIAGIVIYNRLLNNLNRFEDPTVMTAPVDATQSTEETVPPTTLDPYDFDTMFPGEEPIGGEIINIMLVGQDTRDPEYRGLSDTMILVSINPETKKLALTSFMRDMYIDIVGVGGSGLYKDRINTAYCTGGIDQLADTLAYNFGIEIDNFVEVDFYAFETLIDALGGVDVELRLNEAQYMVQYSGNNWDLKEGTNHLSGQQALVYARIRSIDSDFYRTERQRNVIIQVIDKAKQMSIMDIIKFGEEFFPLVTTDMTNREITKYIIQLAPILKDLESTSLRVPVDGTWGGTNVGTEESPKFVIQCLDLKANSKMIEEALGIYSEE